MYMSNIYIYINSQKATRIPNMIFFKQVALR